MPTEIAFFTPRIRTGTAKWLDLWNVDCFDTVSHLNLCHANDMVEFRNDAKTDAENFNTDNPNGIIQAIFDVEESGHYLIIAKLSSTGSYVLMYIDDDHTSSQYIDQNGEDMPGMAYLEAGQHSATVLIKSLWFVPVKDVWFHSLTVFSIT